MRIRVNNLLPVVLMLFLAGLTLWLRQSVEVAGNNAGPTLGPNEPDAIVEHLTIRSLGESGAPEYVISAERMMHYVQNDTTDLVKPLLTKTDDDGTKLSVSAARGTLGHDGDTAAFYGGVTARQVSPNEPDLVAQSEYMQVLSKQDLIRTDRPITITQGSSTLSGVGMEIHRHAQTFSLHSRVKGSYHAPEKK